MERRTLLFEASLGILLLCYIGSISAQNCVRNSRCGENAHYCFNQQRGRRTCQCKNGFQNTTPQRISFLVCRDVNECLTTTTICGPNTVCRNKPGTYECRCSSGFGNIEMLPINQWACTDINECISPLTNICGTGTTCINLVGSFRCDCNAGLNSDGLVKGKYTCSQNSPCSSRGLSCGSGTTCKVTSGNPICACSAGHQNLRITQLPGQLQNAGPSSSVCDDINECLLLNSCDVTSRCENTVGSYACVPDAVVTVFQYIPDVNECTRPGTPACADNQKCVNTVGHYHCIPRDGGTTGANGIFVDINECEMIPNVCQETEDCQNLVGDHRCISKPGYLNGQDINECLGGIGFQNQQNPNEIQNPINTNPVLNPANAQQTQATCLPNDRCVNLRGSYRCVPTNGGTRDIISGAFVDINECEFPGICDGNQFCENTIGSYICQDGLGSSQGVDIDECLSPRPPCVGHNEKCVNTQGSYMCVDNSIGIGGQTQQLDECAVPKICKPHQRCRPIPGGHECPSIDGFDTNGQDKNECILQPNLCTGVGKCINLVGDYICVPINGLEVGQDGVYRDIDECKYPGICHGYEVCVNVWGDYGCQPADGFLNGIDINECDSLGICTGLKSVCVNTMGSYICLPPTGLIGQNDVDECEVFAICGPLRRCENDHGTYRCVSESQGGAVGVASTDENECLTRVNVCPNQNCVNLIGSFRCIPLNGGNTDPSGRFVDINECGIVNALPCGANADCQNTIGAFTCTCHEGFISDAGDGRQCRLFGSGDGRNVQGSLGQSAAGGQLSPEAGMGIGITIGLVALAIIVVVIVAVVLRRSEERSSRAHSESSSFNFQEVENPPSNRNSAIAPTEEPVVSSSPNPEVGHDKEDAERQPKPPVKRRSLLDELYSNYNIPRAGTSTDTGSLYSNDKVKAAKAAQRAEK